MRARKQYNTPYLVLMTFFLYVMTQSTRSTLFGNPWKLLQSDQLLTVFLSVYVFEVKPRHRLTLHSLVYHFIFYPLKWLTRMFEKLKIFHHGNLFLTSLDSAIFLSIVFFLASICVLLITVEYPQFNTAVVAILSYNLSPLYLKLEQTIWGGAGPVMYIIYSYFSFPYFSSPASIGQGMLLYLLRISLDRFVPHLCENEKYMSVQAFIVVSWLILPAGFWDNLIGSLFSSVSPAWQYAVSLSL